MVRPCQRPLLGLLLSIFVGSATAQGDGHKSKRGFGFTQDTQKSDVNLLLSGKSPIDWYYTWSLYPTGSVNNTVPFVPLVHGVNDASSSDLTKLLNQLPSSSTHLLTFNEPDGTKDSGGSSISAKDAAKAYIDYLVPLRTAERRWNISHPVVTGSGQGLDWLRKFNESCYDIDEKNGCPADFIAAHWYGNFEGLSGWLGTLHDFYGNSTATKDLKMWVTEFALPQGGSDATVSMMNESLAYMDKADYIEAYAWFGAFRSGKGNEFVGQDVSLFGDDGKLTSLGAEYLGGDSNGFSAGQGGSSAASTIAPAWMAKVAVALALVWLW